MVQTCCHAVGLPEQWTPLGDMITAPIVSSLIAIVVVSVGGGSPSAWRFSLQRRRPTKRGCYPCIDRSLSPLDFTFNPPPSPSPCRKTWNLWFVTKSLHMFCCKQSAKDFVAGQKHHGSKKKIVSSKRYLKVKVKIYISWQEIKLNSLVHSLIGIMAQDNLTLVCINYNYKLVLRQHSESDEWCFKLQEAVLVLVVVFQAHFSVMHLHYSLMWQLFTLFELIMSLHYTVSSVLLQQRE